jgi:hypothetical protein
VKPPLHQRAVKTIVYIGSGILILGALLDSLANALALLTPLIAIIGTACIVFFWLLITLILHRHPVSWVMGNQQVRLRKLGIKPMAVAVGMILLLWTPSGVMLFQKCFLPLSPSQELHGRATVEFKSSPKPPEIPERPKTLHDYFLSDFNRTSDFISLASIIQGVNLSLQNDGTKKTVKVEVETRLHMDFDARAEFLLFYIPSTDATYSICEHIARELYKKALDQLKNGILMEAKSLPSARGVNISELKFTGGVFIYHEYPLFESNKDTLIPLFKTNGLSPEFRGSDYVNLRNKPPSSPLSAPSPK